MHQAIGSLWCVSLSFRCESLTSRKYSFGMSCAGQAGWRCFGASGFLDDIFTLPYACMPSCTLLHAAGASGVETWNSSKTADDSFWGKFAVHIFLNSIFVDLHIWSQKPRCPQSRALPLMLQSA